VCLLPALLAYSLNLNLTKCLTAPIPHTRPGVRIFAEHLYRGDKQRAAAYGLRRTSVSVMERGRPLIASGRNHCRASRRASHCTPAAHSCPNMTRANLKAVVRGRSAVSADIFCCACALHCAACCWCYLPWRRRSMPHIVVRSGGWCAVQLGAAASRVASISRASGKHLLLKLFWETEGAKSGMERIWCARACLLL